MPQEELMSGTYEDLLAWQKAMDLVVKIYRATHHFPDHEKFGLVAQLRRAAVSVPSNIAEGKGRVSDKELLQFLTNARGSIYEVQTQLTIAQRLGYLDEPEMSALLKESASVGQLVNALIRSYRIVEPREIACR
jgi:four helix bundle protein